MKNFTLDESMLLEDGQQKYIDYIAAGQVAGTPKIIKLGGYTEGFLIIDVKEPINLDEQYTIHLEFSKDGLFLANEIHIGLNSLKIGKMGKDNYEKINLSGRYNIPFCNEINGETYPYVRIGVLSPSKQPAKDGLIFIAHLTA